MNQRHHAEILGAPAHAKRTAVLLAVGLGLIFFTTAPKTSWSSDPLTNMLTAWTLGTRGTVVLTDYARLVEPEAFLQVAWVLRGVPGPVSLFPPGASVLAAPFYIASSDLSSITTIGSSGAPITYGVPPIWPAALVGATSAAIAMALLFVLLCRIGGPRAALFGTLVFAFGTGTWSVASQALWQHGPAMMWIALGLLSPRRLVAGLAWIPAVLTRPLTIAIAALSNRYTGFVTKRWKEFWLQGLSMGAGAALFLLYNVWAFGSWSPFAAYDQNPVLTVLDPNLSGWVANMTGALVDPQRGMFVISPFLLVLLPGLGSAWKGSAVWVRAAALGGLGYLLIQYKSHPFAGGDRFFGYRYALEGLLALGPLLFLSYQTWVSGSRLRLWLFWSAVLIAVGLQAVAVANPHAF